MREEFPVQGGAITCFSGIGESGKGQAGFLVQESEAQINMDEKMDEAVDDALEWLTPEEAAELQDAVREEYWLAFEILRDN